MTWGTHRHRTSKEALLEMLIYFRKYIHLTSLPTFPQDIKALREADKYWSQYKALQDKFEGLCMYLGDVPFIRLSEPQAYEPIDVSKYENLWSEDAPKEK